MPFLTNLLVKILFSHEQNDILFVQDKIISTYFQIETFTTKSATSCKNIGTSL